jgi:hypothetical protein
VLTKIVLKVDFLERDFERDHLAEKATGQKWAKKYTVAWFKNLSIQRPCHVVRGVLLWMFRKLQRERFLPFTVSTLGKKWVSLWRPNFNPMLSHTLQLYNERY